MILNLLADAAAPAPAPDNFSVASLVSILTAIGALVGAIFHGRNQKAAGVKEQKERESVTLNNNPLAVKMEDHFVTRREFDTFKGEIRVDVMDMKGTVEKLAVKMDERDKRYQDKLDERDSRLSAKIEAVASGAYEARRRIHEKVNNHGERLKSLEDRTPVKRPTAGN